MLRLDCQTTQIPLVLPPCSPGGIISASISRLHSGKYTLTATADPSKPGVVNLSGIPTDAARGVYTLALQTNCGCFTASVFYDCEAPAFAGTHQPTSIPGLVKACCDEPMA